MKKKISFIAVLAMAVNIFASALAVNAADSSSLTNGAGTAESPYMISTADEFVKFADDVNGGYNYSGKYVKLSQDIDMETVTGFTGVGFYEYVSLSNSENYVSFNGTFDGNGYEIKNVTISSLPKQAKSTTHVAVGLFGSINGATIKNLGVRNMSLSFEKNGAYYDCGGLVGSAPYTNTIENCYINGLSMEFQKNSNGLGQVGAIVGKSASTGTLTIKNTYVADFKKFKSIGNTVNLGSFMGNITGGTLKIENCYSDGIKDCDITGTGNITVRDGGIAYGTANYDGFAVVSWVKNVTSTSVSKDSGLLEKDGVYSVTEDELKNLSSNDMTAVFKNTFMSDHRNENGGYPMLVKNASENSPFASGNGSETDPYIIDNESELRDFAKSVTGGNDYSGKYIKLTNNIELKQGLWTPIGFQDEDQGTLPKKAFKGTFDGDGYVVKNVNLSRNSFGVNMRQPLGFFSVIGDGAVVKNLGLENVTIDLSAKITGQYAATYVGALAGVIYNGAKAENCFVRNVSLTIGQQGFYYQGVGGIAGILQKDTEKDGSIKNCYVNKFDVTISGESISNSTAYIGGFIGADWWGTAEISVDSGYVSDFKVTGTPPSDWTAQPVCGNKLGNAKLTSLFHNGEYSDENGTKKTESELKALSNGTFINDKNNINNGYPILDSERIWNLRKDGGDLTLSVKGKIFASESDALYIAVYDSDGRFVTCADEDAVQNGDEISVSADVSGLKAGTYKVKGFVWTKSTLNPKTELFETSITL